MPFYIWLSSVPMLSILREKISLVYISQCWDILVQAHQLKMGQCMQALLKYGRQYHQCVATFLLTGLSRWVRNYGEGLQKWWQLVEKVFTVKGIKCFSIRCNSTMAIPHRLLLSISGKNTQAASQLSLWEEHKGWTDLYISLASASSMFNGRLPSSDTLSHTCTSYLLSIQTINSFTYSNAHQ